MNERDMKGLDAGGEAIISDEETDLEGLIEV